MWRRNKNSESEAQLRKYHFYRPTGFWEGFASAFDIFGVLAEDCEIDRGYDADTDAIRADWEVVGADMRTALDEWQKHSMH